MKPIVLTFGEFDFRPSYSKLHIFKECEIQTVAFTGTAERTVPAIIERQKLVNPKVIKMSLDRPNLTYKVTDKHGSKSMEVTVNLVVKGIVNF